MDRQREGGLFDQLIVGHRAVVVPQHPFDDRALGVGVAAVEGRYYLFDVHTTTLAAGAVQSVQQRVQQRTPVSISAVNCGAVAEPPLTCAFDVHIDTRVPHFRNTELTATA